MDDSGFKSTRLSLMIISIGIIIYIFGDGTVNGANIFFGSLSLKDTTPVTYTAILIYIYMLWRYWLYRHEVTGNFGDEFKEMTSNVNAFVHDRKTGKLYLVGVGPNDHFWKFEMSKERHAAVGSGSDHALTAMDMGATAEEAVKMAMKRDVMTGGRIRLYRA